MLAVRKAERSAERVAVLDWFLLREEGQRGQEADRGLLGLRCGGGRRHGGGQVGGHRLCAGRLQLRGQVSRGGGERQSLPGQLGGPCRVGAGGGPAAGQAGEAGGGGGRGGGQQRERLAAKADLGHGGAVRRHLQGECAGKEGA